MNFKEISDCSYPFLSDFRRNNSVPNWQRGTWSGQSPSSPAYLKVRASLDRKSALQFGAQIATPAGVAKPKASQGPCHQKSICRSCQPCVKSLKEGKIRRAPSTPSPNMSTIIRGRAPQHYATRLDQRHPSGCPGASDKAKERSLGWFFSPVLMVFHHFW